MHKIEKTNATGKHDYQVIGSTAASCTEYGSKTYGCKCDDACEAGYTVQVPKSGHKWEEVAEKYVAPTCCESGKKVLKCAECGEEKSIVISATGKHTWAQTEIVNATCATAGYVKYECQAEGCVAVKKQVIPANGMHVKAEDDEGEIVAEATADLEGTICYDCEVCKKNNVVSEKI